MHFTTSHLLCFSLLGNLFCGPLITSALESDAVWLKKQTAVVLKSYNRATLLSWPVHKQTTNLQKKLA